MTRRRTNMLTIKEILYRYQLGISKRQIAKALNLSRKVVRKIIELAEQKGFRALDGNADLDGFANVVHAAKTVVLEPKPGSIEATIAKHHQQISDWLLEPHITTRQIFRLLNKAGVEVGETSVRCYIRKNFPAKIDSTVHLLTVPGKQAQVDFGYVGRLYDKAQQKLRKANVFIMTLSHSRYRFIRFVFKQDSETWLDCHMRAFEFFGGVPESVLIDNLRSGVTNADIYDPVINRNYGELEKHYGFIVDPAKVRTPKHKGKVERSVAIARNQLIAGCTYTDIDAANNRALDWCRNEISQRICRSTGRTPWKIFESEEKNTLLPLPKTRFELSVWYSIKVQRDQHIVVNSSFYSVPYQYIGKEVMARSGSKCLQIFYQEHLIKTHIKAKTKATWTTDVQDYPRAARIFLEADKTTLLEKAKEIGMATYEFCVIILNRPSSTNTRKTLAVLRLAEVHSSKSLENACEKALHYGNHTVKALKKIIEDDFEESQQKVQYSPVPGGCLRDPAEFANYNN